MLSLRMSILDYIKQGVRGDEGLMTATSLWVYEISLFYCGMIPVSPILGTLGFSCVCMCTLSLLVVYHWKSVTHVCFNSNNSTTIYSTMLIFQFSNLDLTISLFVDFITETVESLEMHVMLQICNCRRKLDFVRYQQLRVANYAFVR